MSRVGFVGTLAVFAVVIGSVFLAISSADKADDDGVEARSAYSDLKIEQVVSFDGMIDQYRRYDVLGIYAGMSATSAREVISRDIGSIQYERETHILDRDKRSPSYVDKIVFESDDNEDVAGGIYLAPPSGGNAVIGAFQRVNFSSDKGQPSVSAIRKLLEAKYGPPTSDRVEGREHKLGWMIGSRGECSDTQVCNEPVDTWLATYIPAQSDTVKLPPDLIVVAVVEEQAFDETRARSLIVSLSEHSLRYKAEEANRLLAAEAQEAFDRNTDNLPRL